MKKKNEIIPQLKCSNCGSIDVEYKVWYNPNTEELRDEAVLDGDDCWCNGCEEHHDLIDIDDEI